MKIRFKILWNLFDWKVNINSLLWTWTDDFTRLKFEGQNTIDCGRQKLTIVLFIVQLHGLQTSWIKIVVIICAVKTIFPNFNVKMQLFQFTQEYFALLGITSKQLTQKYPFNYKMWMISFSYGLSSISHMIFFIQAVKSANSFTEYIDSIFGTASTISVAIYFLITVFNKSILFKYIDNCGKNMDKSE